MRKEIAAGQAAAAEAGRWMDLEALARVRISSETATHPVENALTLNPEKNEEGWQAASAGPQIITLLFDHPLRIRRIQLHFLEREHERSQEFALRAARLAEPAREILRQQWSFSPQGSTQELEDYRVELDEVTSLELTIDPDRGQGRFPATLTALRVA